MADALGMAHRIRDGDRAALRDSTAALPGRTARDAAARVATFLYGLVAYSVFLGTILYAIGFVTGLVVPKTIDTGTAPPTTEALIVNVLHLAQPDARRSHPRIRHRDRARPVWRHPGRGAGAPRRFAADRRSRCR